MAPVMTTRMSANKASGGGNTASSEIWKYVEDSGETDIYYGTTDNQRAMIGQNKAETAENARLILNTSDDIPNHLMFKKGDGTLGSLSINSDNSILLGTQAKDATFGIYDIAIGTEVNANSKSGYGNAIAIGYKAEAIRDTYNLYPNSKYNGPIAIGYNTSATGDGSVAIGAYSKANAGTYASAPTKALAILGTATGANSIAIFGTASGDHSLAINGTASGKRAIAIGSSMCPALAKGLGAIAISGNGTAIAYGIAIGNSAENLANADGSYYSSQIAIGEFAITGGGPSIAIGYDTSATGSSSVAIGARAKATTANTIVLGTTFETVKIPGSLTVATTSYPSDRKLKNIGKEYISSLDKIKQLKPFNFTYKDDKNKTPRVGVIAQDLQKVFPNAVSKGKDGFLTIRLEDMFYAVINSIKELDAKIVSMSKILKQVQDDNAQLKKENKELREILNQVQNDNKLLKKRLEVLEGK